MSPRMATVAHSRNAAGMLDRMHANHVAAQQQIAHLNPGGATACRGPWLLIGGATPEMPVFNIAIIESSPEGAALSTPQRWFEARDTTHHLMLRDSADAELIQAARREGYAIDYVEPALVLESPGRPPPPPAGLRVHEVASAGQLEIYGAVGWQADGLEHVGLGIAHRARELGFTMLLGEVDGRAIASSMAVVTDGLVGIYNLAVAPSHRRQGFGTAMVWAAIGAGVRRGANAAWIGSTPMSNSLYERIGFSKQYEYVALTRIDCRPGWIVREAAPVRPAAWPDSAARYSWRAEA